jgi:hypothetical protein
VFDQVVRVIVGVMRREKEDDEVVELNEIGTSRRQDKTRRTRGGEGRW